MAWLLLPPKQKRTFFMKMMVTVAALIISAVPGYAHDQSTVAKLKADAEKLVKMTSGDKQKTQTYCEFADLSDQIGEANEDQDTEKAEELSKKADEVEKKLGPEFVALADELSKLDPSSEESKEIGSILDKLDELCGD
jgi:ABC-type transporter Mla subunit MlaD